MDAVVTIISLCGDPVYISAFAEGLQISGPLEWIAASLDRLAILQEIVTEDPVVVHHSWDEMFGGICT